MITTKSGKGFDKADKKFSVSINSGVSFQMAYLQINRQDKFGQGYDNAPDAIENFSGVLLLMALYVHGHQQLHCQVELLHN